MKVEAIALLALLVALVWLVFIHRSTRFINMNGEQVPYTTATIWEQFFNKVME